MGNPFSASRDGECSYIVQYNGADRNSYFPGRDLELGRLGGIVGSFLA